MDRAKIKFGIGFLFLSALSLVAGITIFLSKDKTIGNLDLGRDADLFGWVMTVMAILLAALGAACAVLISDQEKSKPAPTPAPTTAPVSEPDSELEVEESQD